MFVKKTVSAVVFSLISGASLASVSQPTSPLTGNVMYDNKPLYFGGQVYKQFEVNLIFKTAYQNKFKTPSDKVVDTVQISNKYVALLVINNGQKKIVFTDGSKFFTAKNSPTKLINENTEKKLLEAYETAYPQQEQKTEELSVIHKTLSEIKKQDEPVFTPPKPKNRVVLKSSVTTEKPIESASKNALDSFFYKKISTVTPFFLAPEDKSLPNIYVFVSSHCGYCKKFIVQYKAHPEVYKEMNMAFIPVGNPNDIKDGKWKAFFGVEPADLTPADIIKNNDFFDGATKANKEPGYATPSYLWNSKQKGRVYKANGLISLDSMELVKNDLVKFKKTEQKQK